MVGSGFEPKCVIPELTFLATTLYIFLVQQNVEIPENNIQASAALVGVYKVTFAFLKQNFLHIMNK